MAGLTRARDTIAAIATAPGSGGVAIVRVSGPEALAIVGPLFRRSTGEGLPEPRRVYVGSLLDRSAGEVVDEVLAFWMRGPRTYTGEDVVEIQCHGGSLVSRNVLEAVCTAGARPADPGEFTKRAFLNGRVDLAQAEAVADLIAARSEAGRRLAWSQLAGSLSDRVGVLREAIVRVRARCEVALDFPEDDVPELGDGELAREIESVRRELEALVATFERGRLNYEGARVALIGRPNVGKSSLLNALAGRERAIVTPIPGTTRDVLEACVAIRGVPVTFMDTAGLREAADVVETMGVDRSRRAIEESACVVAVFDRSVPLGEDDELVADAVKHASNVVALNKSDLPPVLTAERVRTLVGPCPVVELSARSGQGVADLVAAIGGSLFGASATKHDDEVTIFRTRHHDAARNAIVDLAGAEESLAKGSPLEIVASDLTAAASALAEITGEVTSEDVLDRVFADFCLGK